MKPNYNHKKVRINLYGSRVHVTFSCSLSSGYDSNRLFDLQQNASCQSDSQSDSRRLFQDCIITFDCRGSNKRLAEVAVSHI